MKTKTNLDHTLNVLYELHMKDLTNPIGAPTTDYDYYQAKTGIFKAQHRIQRLTIICCFLTAGAIGLLFLLTNIK